MSRFPLPFLVAALAMLPLQAASAQGALPFTELPAPVHGRTAPEPGNRNEIALEVGILTGGLSFARRVGDTPLSVGAGVWGAWEPPNSFDRNLWEPLGLVGFGRYRPTSWLHADLGVMGARYFWADDCSECSGSFVGLRSAALIGRRMVFVGPEVAVGRASDERNGSEFGVIWGAQVRLLLGWGR